MKSLLVHASPKDNQRSWNYLEHLGLVFIEKALLNHGYPVDVFDAVIHWDDADTNAKQIFSPKGPYCLLGFSVNRSNFESTIQVIQIARKKGFKGHITLGGYFPTFHFKKILRFFPEVDSIVLGHGEYTFLKLCQHLSEASPVEKIPGLAFRNGDDHIHA